ncbi:hypothetical protein SAMN04487897_101862 [Paenibacillus sp. yr247]|nr:hypothetical protein SAMN04487897_101862 [Paenibacillus sp. yr247]
MTILSRWQRSFDEYEEDSGRSSFHFLKRMFLSDKLKKERFNSVLSDEETALGLRFHLFTKVITFCVHVLALSAALL